MTLVDDLQALLDRPISGTDSAIRRITDDERLAGCAREMQRRGVLPGSVDARLRRVRALMRWAEPLSVLELTTEQIETYLKQLGLIPNTRRGYTRGPRLLPVDHRPGVHHHPTHSRHRATQATQRPPASAHRCRARPGHRPRQLPP